MLSHNKLRDDRNDYWLDRTRPKNALSSLQKDVSNLKSNVGDVSLTAGGVDIQNAYNFGVFGLCLGAAGVIIAIVAMIRRK